MSAAGAAALMVTVALALMPLIPAVAFRHGEAVAAAGASYRGGSARRRADCPGRGCAPQSGGGGPDRHGRRCGMGLIGDGAEIALGLDHGVLAAVMAAVLACVLLLRARVFRGRAQRLWLLIPGYGGISWCGLAASGGRHAARCRAASWAPLW